MQANYHQYSPSELYIGMGKELLTVTAEVNTASTPPPTECFRVTGCFFLDAFVGNLHQYGYRTGLFHARLLGISPTEFYVTMQTITGMPYTDFASEYILLMAKDLMGDKQKKLTHLPARLGFGSYSGFYRFIKRQTKEKPSRC